VTAIDTPKRNLAPKLIRLALTAIVLGWVISRVGLAQVVDTLRDADLLPIFVSMLVFQAGVALRSLRWWMLLQGGSIHVSYRYVLGLVYVSEFFLGALPANYAGDLVRIIEFKNGNSNVVTAGTVILDRIIGLIGLISVVLIALAVGYQKLPADIALSLALISLSILFFSMVILQGSIVNRLVRALPDLFSRIRADWLTPLTHALIDADRGRLLLAFALSMLNTVLTVFNHYMVALAVGVQVGIGLFFVFSPTVNLSLMLPTISGLGLREVGYQILLEPFGVSASVAVALGIGVYISRLSASLIGGLYYTLLNLRR
jgi:uncharacterized protein (TIRG00374 family)